MRFSMNQFGLRVLEFFLIALSILVFSLLFLTIFDPFHTQPRQRDMLREKHLEMIENVLLLALKEKRTPLSLGISAYPQQIGFASSGCVLQTKNCQIAENSCINLHQLVQKEKKDWTLPSDILHGNSERTGYAVYLKDKKTLVIVACYAERDGSITKEISL